MTHALPWRGLGLSSNLDATAPPHPYRLLDARPGLFDFVEYSAPLALDEARGQAPLFAELWARRAEVPALFHPVHLNLYGPTLESEGALRQLAEHARAVGSAWVGNDVGWWHQGGEPFPGYFYLPPPLTGAGVADSAVHALHVQAALPVLLLLENPAVIALRGELHVLDFMARLHARTGLPLLLDLGHLLSHQLSRGLPLMAGLDGFPLERVVEIHLAGGVVTARGARRFYADDHTQPVREELFELLEAILPRCRELRAVTFEGDGHPAEIAALTLRRLRRLVPRERPGELQVEAPKEAPAERTALSTRPWELFERAYAGAGTPEDPEGEAAERDLRLATVAQLLDAQWPATRLLAAGTREDVAAFCASPEYREAFEGGSVGRAFGAWARRTVRARRDDAAAAALAFETWAHGIHAHPTTPAPGHVGPAPDVVVQAFPFDLSELLFATRAVRRHLLGRVWAGAPYELSGLDGLRQVALRPGPGPWRVAVRKVGGRLDVRPVPPSVEPALRAAERLPPMEDFIEGRAGAAPEAAREAIALGLVRSA